ncbi:hypothetical protein [Polynucleobacter necessarius]|nr:hypothetical protein [Polynucleobacter necessarius]
MTSGNTPKINVRNSVVECAQPLKKENTTITALKTASPLLQPQRENNLI